MADRQQTATVVRTRIGLLLKFTSVDDIIGYCRRHEPHYEIRHGNELWHKRLNCLAGIVEKGQ